MYVVVCPNMETNNFITENFASKCRKLESVENKIRDIFNQCLVFNKRITPLTFVGYELMMADSVLCTSATI